VEMFLHGKIPVGTDLLAQQMDGRKALFVSRRGRQTDNNKAKPK